MYGFTPLDITAVAFFLCAWLGYHLMVESFHFGGSSLNLRMNYRRVLWLEQTIRRENRIFDAQILNALQQGTAFFASTSLIAIGGSMALLQSTDRLLELVGDFPLAVIPTRFVWEMKVIGFGVIFAYAFFKFAWAYRLFNYLAILLGALPRTGEADQRHARAAVKEAAALSISAGRHFNRGQRAFFFAIAYLAWFLGPLVFLAATGGVLFVMAHRQFLSEAAMAIGDEKSLTKEAPGRDQTA